MSVAIDIFVAEMEAEFDALLNGGLLSKIGTADDFDFDLILKRLRIWRVVPSFEIALFCCDSITSNNAGTAMINGCTAGPLKGAIAFNDDMRKVVQSLRPRLDDKWGDFCAGSRFGEEFRWDVSMPRRLHGLLPRMPRRAARSDGRGLFS